MPSRVRGARRVGRPVLRECRRFASMKKLAGIVLFLVLIYVLLLGAGEAAASVRNHFNLGQRIGLYGILTLAAGLVIITGNIDLSIGSVVGLCSTIFCLMLMSSEWVFGMKLS